MFFALSKILWSIINPFNLLILFLFLGIVLKTFNYLKSAKAFFLISFMIFILIGFFPTGNFLMFILEKKFHNQAELPEKVDGILILSGATNPYLSKVHKQVSLNGASERLFESIKLIKKYPGAKIVFSGGSGSLNSNLTHSEVAKKFYSSLDIDLNRIYFEDKSKNTHENILFSKKIFKPKKNEKWILVTSAFHLNRAINIAEKVDWEFIPYATDFNLPKKFSWKPSFNFIGNIYSFQNSSHEWVGLIVYDLTGKS